MDGTTALFSFYAFMVQKWTNLPLGVMMIVMRTIVTETLLGVWR